jgi:1-acyl-sn-glycerol-3-phosphate acyltransferase
VFLVGSGITLVAPDLRRRWTRVMFRRWSRGLSRIFGLRIEVSGNPPLPPFLLVANHLSYVDIILLGSQVPGRFVAKREVRDWPVWGALARLTDTIFVDREDRRDAVRVTRLLQRALAEGDGVILFPEGTSSAGERVLPLKPTLLEAAARQGWPVRYASISYRVPPGETPAHLSVCWWGDMPFGPHLLGLCRLAEVTGHLHLASDEVRGSNRKELAQRLHAAISRQFIPVVTQDSP